MSPALLWLLKQMIPNQDQIYSLIRNFIFAQGAIIATHGIFVTSSQLEAISGGAAALVAIVLSLIFHSDNGQSLLAPPKK